MFQAEQQAIEQGIQAYCAQHKLPAPQALVWSPIPFSGEWGISTSFFQLAAQEARLLKADGQNPTVPVAQRAQEIAAGVAAYLGQPAGFNHIEAVKGYLNLYFDSGEYARRVVDTVLEQGKHFGHGAPKGQRVMVEFSQPNTHKAMHVGHLRSAILGDALARILEAAGYEVVRANYIGDIGLHVVKWLWEYMKHHAGEKPDQDITQWMGNIYAEANRRLEEDPTLETEVRELYRRWDRREPDVFKIWEETRQWSLDGFDQIYHALDIRFDRPYFPSEEEHPGKLIVEQLIKTGIAIDERPEGPVIVKLDEQLGLTKEKYRVLVVQRSDDTALYATEDLALAVHKFTEYPDLVKSIYVVDVRQSLHFIQVFKTLELAGYPWADRCLHVAYEVVVLPGNVILASRDGNVVLLEQLIREAIERSLAVVTEKNPSLDDDQRQQVARAVGLGAIKYPLLARDNAKIATFDWQSALDFNGQAAPYIQYAHVRANSILRRQEQPLPGSLTPAYALHPTEIELIDRLSRLPGEVQRAAAEQKTLYVTNIAYEIARAFTDFYAACPVIKAEPHVRDARLRLTAAARQAMNNALLMLGITAPDVM